MGEENVKRWAKEIHDYCQKKSLIKIIVFTQFYTEMRHLNIYITLLFHYAMANFKAIIGLMDLQNFQLSEEKSTQ